MISNLAWGRMDNSPEPQVGDEIEYAGGLPTAPHQPRRYLAVKIGPVNDGVLWLALNSEDGTLSAVSVGRFWKLKDLP